MSLSKKSEPSRFTLSESWRVPPSGVFSIACAKSSKSPDSTTTESSPLSSPPGVSGDGGVIFPIDQRLSYYKYFHKPLHH